MYDGGSKDWNDGWPTEKYEKVYRRSEHCILSSVAFYVGRGTEYTYSGSKDWRIYSQTNRIGGLVLSVLVQLRQFPPSHNIDMIHNS